MTVQDRRIRRHRLMISAVILSLLITFNSCSDRAIDFRNEIVGTWKSSTPGRSLRFEPNGQYVQETPNYYFSGPYRIEKGPVLVTSYMKKNGDHDEMSYEIRIDGNLLSRIRAGEEEQYTRADPDILKWQPYVNNPGSFQFDRKPDRQAPRTTPRSTTRTAGAGEKKELIGNYELGPKERKVLTVDSKGTVMIGVKTGLSYEQEKAQCQTDKYGYRCVRLEWVNRRKGRNPLEEKKFMEDYSSKYDSAGGSIMMGSKDGKIEFAVENLSDQPLPVHVYIWDRWGYRGK